MYKPNQKERIQYNTIQYNTKKRRLDVEFVKKITLEMVIGQHMKEEGHHQNEPPVLNTHPLSKEELLSLMLSCSVYLYSFAK